MADLKPCPFCGGVVNWCDCGADCPQITCPHCGQFDLVKAGETLEGAKQEAETTWNNRPFEQRLAEADERIAELEAAHRWIPVTERMPKWGATILAVDNSGDMGVCTFVNAKFVGECFGFEAYLDDGGWDCSPSKVTGEYVTHWMTPEPPESGRGSDEQEDELTAAYLAGRYDARKEYEQRLAEAEAKLAETENGLRWVCDIYIVDDSYTGDLRAERLERAVRYAMKKGRLKETSGSEGE